MNRRLSVAMLGHLASPVAPTGAEHSLALLARGLRARGHRVRVLVPRTGWALAGELSDAGVEIEPVAFRPCWLAYHDPVALPLALWKGMRCVAGKRGTRNLHRRLLAFGPDLVYVNCLPHLPGAAAGAATGVPVIWHLREILPPGPRRRWWARRLRRFSRRIVAVSEAVAGWAREEGLGARIEVVPNGVDTAAAVIDRRAARRELGVPQDGGCLIGLVGQILPHKGVVEFLRAGQRVLARQPGCRLLLAGAGPAWFLRKVERQITAGMASRVHLLPPRPQAATFLAACDIVSLTSRTPDPFPRVVLEAMAAARPVVAFRSGGVPEMVEHGVTGLLVEPGDVDGLASHLLRLAADAVQRRSLGEAGACRARREFSLELHVRRMEQLFLEVTPS
jgi:glycosyltransferase involved in cell wall biosynthesis